MYFIIVFIFIILYKLLKYDNHDFKVKFGMVQLDVGTIFAAVYIVRLLHGNLLHVLVLVIFHFFIIFLAHNNKNRILEELKNPKTMIGKVLALVGFVGGGIAGIFSFLMARYFDIIFVCSFIYSGLLLVVLIFHASWPNKNTEREVL